MAAQTIHKFLELLKRSNLLEEDRIVAAIAEFRTTREAPPQADAAELSAFFVERGLLTSWQAGQLQSGVTRGFILGKHRLLSHLGSGGMSHVYLAENTRLKRLVAVKVLPEKRVNDSSYLARFTLEARAAATLDHPNIVRVYDIDNEGTLHYIVMEYVDGRTLQQVVKAEGPLPVASAVEYLRQAASGLAHAHEAGLVHRDIKPGNLLLDKRGVVKLLDLGLALWSDDEQASLTLAHDENVLGTADYLAPEQAISSHDVDARADIYSLGCTLYFLLAGRPPFPEGSIAQRIAKHQRQEPQSILELRSDVPPALAEMCRKMMAKAKERRYQSAQEIVQAIEAFQASGSGVPALGQTGSAGGQTQQRAAVQGGRLPGLPAGRGPAASIAEVVRDETDRPTIIGAAPNTIAEGGSDRQRGSGKGKRLPVAKAIESRGDLPDLLVEEELKSRRAHRKQSKTSGAYIAFCIFAAVACVILLWGVLKVMQILDPR